jgi:hypothetical protein
MARLVALLLVLVPLSASARQPTWYLLMHDDGCVNPELLVTAERLLRAPVSPEEFAQMMRERGEAVTIGQFADSPPGFSGQMIQVKYGNSKAPIFVTEEFCRKFWK